MLTSFQAKMSFYFARARFVAREDFIRIRNAIIIKCVERKAVHTILSHWFFLLKM